MQGSFCFPNVFVQHNFDGQTQLFVLLVTFLGEPEPNKYAFHQFPCCLSVFIQIGSMWRHLYSVCCGSAVTLINLCLGLESVWQIRGEGERVVCSPEKSNEAVKHYVRKTQSTTLLFYYFASWILTFWKWNNKLLEWKQAYCPWGVIYCPLHNDYDIKFRCKLLSLVSLPVRRNLCYARASP